MRRVTTLWENRTSTIFSGELRYLLRSCCAMPDTDTACDTTRRHNDGECRDDFRATNIKEVTMEVDRSLWYHRFENNGWRPIANKHLHSRDLVAISTAERRVPNFHHMVAPQCILLRAGGTKLGVGV